MSGKRAKPRARNAPSEAPSPPGGGCRLDELLVTRALVENRTRAQALILAGRVFAEHERLDKPGRRVPVDIPLTVRGPAHPWVSRGGVKLAYALDRFQIPVAGLIGLDIGASTGGFTHVLLDRGAARVYAVDVGHGQLAWSLRQDERVVVLEKTNCRMLDRSTIPDPPALVVCDVSFIGLQTALPAALALCATDATLVALIKPQFEAGREHVGKGGIVRDGEVRARVCERIGAWLAGHEGWTVLGIVDSPIQGADGNVEHLIAARRGAGAREAADDGRAERQPH